ncbi:TIGR02677 family protein [Nitriliruptor alkaliphilus]|uniref:TIGR02677 family protein n=1 Tax=Nitriliruptor alkaliphilus TaxID=427918 RepID=UPI0006980F90|nr:TIGR02677 family protein [Nitriliruptor alkaliphilus]
MGTSNEARWAGLPRGLFGPVSPSAERRDLYLAVLACFEDAHVEPALNLEQLSRRLGTVHTDLADDDTLVNILDQLEGWGHLAASRDESATYRDPSEFRRRTLQWSLTGDGQGCVAGLNAAAQRLAETAGLQPAALTQIASALHEVADHASDPDGQPAQVHLRLVEAEGHHRSLVENLRAFTIQVQELLGRTDVNDDDLAAAKSAILAYLHRYVVDAGPPARQVAAALDRLEQVGFDTVVEQAVIGAHLAPGLGGDDPAVRAVEQRRRGLDALDAWFRVEAGALSPFDLLLPRGRDQILRFMRVLELRREQRRRAASLPDDFRALARAFAGAAGREDCHRLWVAATALHPARHHHLAVDDALQIHSATRIAGNPPVELEVELRRRPRSTGRERAATPVRDDRAARAARQRQQATELAEAVQRRQAIATDGTVRISSFDELDLDTFSDLLDLLAQTLSTSPRSDGARSAVSADGQVEVVVHRLDTDRRALLVSPDGTLDTPDYSVTITLLGVEVTARQGAGVGS